MGVVNKITKLANKSLYNKMRDALFNSKKGYVVENGTSYLTSNPAKSGVFLFGFTLPKAMIDMGYNNDFPVLYSKNVINVSLPSISIQQTEYMLSAGMRETYFQQFEYTSSFEVTIYEESGGILSKAMLDWFRCIATEETGLPINLIAKVDEINDDESKFYSDIYESYLSTGFFIYLPHMLANNIDLSDIKANSLFMIIFQNIFPVSPNITSVQADISSLDLITLSQTFTFDTLKILFPSVDDYNIIDELYNLLIGPATEYKPWLDRATVEELNSLFSIIFGKTFTEALSE